MFRLDRSEGDFLEFVISSAPPEIHGNDDWLAPFCLRPAKASRPYVGTVQLSSRYVKTTDHSYARYKVIEL